MAAELFERDEQMTRAETRSDLQTLRQRIRDVSELAEEVVVNGLMKEAQLSPEQLKKAQALAGQLAEGVRKARINAGSIDLLTQEFSLDSREGIALMCLAEAMLRIPDVETRNRLIRDKIVDGDWRSHVGKSPSMFVNATAWGLLFTGKVLKQPDDSVLLEALSSVLRKGGEAVVRGGVSFAMLMLGKQFVTGETIEEAIRVAKEREARGYCYSYDMLGEAALTQEDAQAYFDAYWHAIEEIGKSAKHQGPIMGHGVSVKLTGLHPRYEVVQRERVIAEMYPKLLQLACAAKKWNIGFHLDQEDAARFDLTIEMLERLASAPELKGWDGLGISVQAYQKCGTAVVDWVIGLARANRCKILVRLVKGAYWDTEIKRCQTEGTDEFPVFTRKVHSDVSYIACAKHLLDAQDAVFPQFATHNAFSIAAIHTLGGNKEYEFQCLHGMGETVYDQVVGDNNLGRRCRIYAPVGPHETLLAYLVRRLLENGANSSFVSQIVKPEISISEIVEDPIARAARTGGKPHPKIMLPPALLPGRKNAAALQLAGSADFEKALAELSAHRINAEPLLGEPTERRGVSRCICSPSDETVVVGSVSDSSLETVDAALAIAATSGASWGKSSLEERTEKLRAVGDVLERDANRLCAILVRESGMTLQEAAQEVRQAVALCRLYAHQADADRNLRQAQPLGAVVSISPASAPLSALVGQVAAALITGNAVLAKPSSSAPLIAFEAVRSFHRAGVPAAALQLVPGAGSTVGHALTRDARVAAILFSGSQDVAREIGATLAAASHEPVFVATTGGFNSMIVDSSALPEQVISDAINSAFDCAGQRSSSLRLLCLQDSTAEKVLKMLRSMLRERVVGQPSHASTDIGPVATKELQNAFGEYVRRMADKGFEVARAPVGDECAKGRFVAPAIIDLGDLDAIEQIDQTISGPVLHVVRWKSGQLERLLTVLNERTRATALGLHTRINETAGKVLSMAHADNVYINRAVHAAAAGMHPTGGMCAGGTGPKVDGPITLYRLVKSLPVAWSGDKGPFARTAQWASDKFYEIPVIEEGKKLVARKVFERNAIDERMSLLKAVRDAAQGFGVGEEGKKRIARHVEKLSSVLVANTPFGLPAPAGEENTLELLAAGRLLCVAQSDESLVKQTLAAIAFGNTALLPRSKLAETLQGIVGNGRCIIVDNDIARSADKIAAAQPRLVLTDLSGENLASLRKRAQSASRNGVSVVTSDSDGSYDWSYLVRERTTSINVSAAGGNTQLMMLTEEAA
ncbi:bifunctional proline dehydrogenase/L-glutamate gamma-semialdehyde dehydrogenase PutA [Aromatoleum evansii]|uniref:Bifunctional protein PutA n=1 Tax=Aromatoleum evansii TaxID=59406 RepID=A0ABZ1AJ65_AROEV|nr:bifunctional proline dehydrogenase/L-glutamate gamma-semialdehyde dehydrogenase PutA [Aromatoleum evansii]